MGRKPRPKKGKLQVLNMRTTADLRGKLEDAATANGRSLSAEVEERLFASFLTRDEVFGDEHTYRLMTTLAAAIGAIEAATGESWRDDEDTRFKIQNVMVQTLSLMANPESVSEPVDPADWTDDELEILDAYAGATWDELKGVIGQERDGGEQLRAVRLAIERVSARFLNLKKGKVMDIGGKVMDIGRSPRKEGGKS